MANISAPIRTYKYVDDTGQPWIISCADHLAATGGLEPIPLGNPEKLGPIPHNYKPRHIKLVALSDRPGMQKYRTEVITDERDPSKFFNRTVLVSDEQMRCTRYVGEQRTGH
jgi:hypothetical protein